ncbi:hypothetical protein C8R46DRAFT_1311848, partial [Mycena filopes]
LLPNELPFFLPRIQTPKRLPRFTLLQVALRLVCVVEALHYRLGASNRPRDAQRPCTLVLAETRVVLLVGQNHIEVRGRCGGNIAGCRRVGVVDGVPCGAFEAGHGGRSQGRV